MISPIDPSGAMFLANLAQIQNNMQQAQTELSSGLKFQNASDAPDQVSDTGGGVVQLTVTQASRQIQDPLGNTFSVDLTAQQIFDDQNPDGTPAADNVFTAVNQLRVSLQNNDSAGIQSSITALTTADDHLNEQLGFYGAAENRLQAATSLSQQMNLTYQTALGSDQDADMAQAATQLTESQTREQAALQAQSMEPRTSLFNFLG